MVEITNIVGSGDLGKELDLQAVAQHAELDQHEGISKVEHSRRKGNRIMITFDDGPTGILAPSGVYILTGVKTYESLYRDRDLLLGALSESEVVPDADPKNFEVQNVVCVGELNESNLNLNELSLLLGLEKSEYEPEQFPGLVYRPDESSIVLLVFGSGKVVLTGANSEDIAKEELDNLQNLLQQSLPS